MVVIRFTRMQIQELRLWAMAYRDSQLKVGLSWDEDQKILKEKLDDSIGSEHL